MSILQYLKSTFINFLILSKVEKIKPFYFESELPEDEFICKLKRKIAEPQPNKYLKYSGWVNKGHMKLYINFLNDDEGQLHSEFEIELNAKYISKLGKTIIEGNIFIDNGVSSNFYYVYFFSIIIFILFSLFSYDNNPLKQFMEVGIAIFVILILLYFFIQPYKKYSMISDALFLNLFEQIE
ncbi:MAG: hypothetical protein IPP53_08670 [Bacteroidetes bacterium]|nr:hypothetical protein [Bacteroidota bacterium]